MQLASIRSLHAYDAWANQRVADTLATPGVPDQPKRTFNHVIAALELWWSRFAGTPLGAWQAFPRWSPDETGARLARITGLWTSALTTLDEGELSREIAFVDSRGTPQRDRIGDFLIHLVTHGTHHRGQALSQLRAAGIAPPAIDYMVYYRSLR